MPGTPPTLRRVQTATAETQDDDTERTTVRAGREFEQEYRLDAADTGALLVGLGEQFR